MVIKAYINYQQITQIVKSDYKCMSLGYPEYAQTHQTIITLP
jgi:hypothetical protein